MARRRGKPLSAEDRKARTLERIVDVFATKGFAGTTTAALARASGVSEALLYKIFRTKKAMYREMIRAKLSAIATAIEPGAPGDDRGFFLGLARTVMARTKEDPAFVRLLLFSQLQGDPFAEMFRQAHSQAGMARVEAYIRERVADGVFRDVRPDLAAWGFLSMVWEYALHAFVFGSPQVPRADDIEDVLSAFVEIFLRGVRA